MAIEYRVKVNLASGEIEVSGDRKFVDQKLKDLPVLLEALKNPGQATPAAVPVQEKPAAKKRGGKPGKAGKSKAVKAKPAVSKAKPATSKAKPVVSKAKPAVTKAKPAAKPALKMNTAGFKAEYKKYPKKLSQNDAVLLSGIFTQKSALDNKFTSADVDHLLNSVNKQISNTSVSLSQLRVGKKIERVGKTGRIVHYRVTSLGEERLQKALAKA